VTSDRRVGPARPFLDPFVLDAIEVARGPGSVAYGSDAFGGVVFAKTRRVAPNAPLGARVVAALGAGVAAGASRRRGVEGVHEKAAWSSRRTTGTSTTTTAGGRSGTTRGATDKGFLAHGQYEVGAGVLSAVWQSDFGSDIGRPREQLHDGPVLLSHRGLHRLTVGYDAQDVVGLRAGPPSTRSSAVTGRSPTRTGRHRDASGR